MDSVRRTTILLRDRAGSTDLDRDGWRAQLDASAGGSDQVDLVQLVVTPGAQPSLTRAAGWSVVTCSSLDWWREAPALLGLSAQDLVVVAEAASTPSPRLVERLVSAYDAHPGAVVDARVIPLEVTQAETPGAAKRFEDNAEREAKEQAEEQRGASQAGEQTDDQDADDQDADDQDAELAVTDEADEPPLPTEHPVSGACTLLDAEALARVGTAWSGAVSTPESAVKSAEMLIAGCDDAGFELMVEPQAAIFRSVRVAEDGSPVMGNRVRDARLDDFVAAPIDHPAALEATTLSRLLGVVGMGHVPKLQQEVGEPRPFLSIITRTQGVRAQALEDVLTCLAAQTDRDFEMLVMCHRAAPDAVAGIRDLVTALPSWLAERIRVVEVERPGRAAPLNDGFELARGRYIVMLDDDDVVLEHWVETFHLLETEAQGQMLRAAALLHRVVDDPRFDDLVPLSAGNAVRNWPLTFRLVDHLRANFTPCMTVAFPWGSFHHLGLRFDESLNTTEDWDLIVRTAGVVGVASAREVTSIYRWWEARGSSRAAHSTDEWDDTMQRVLRGFMGSPLLVSPDMLPRFSALLDRSAMDAKRAHELARTYATSQHEVILTLNEVKKAHDQAVRSRDTWQKRAGIAKAKVEKLRTKLNDRHERHLKLLREADQLLSERPHLRPAVSIFELEHSELRALVEELREAPSRRPLGARLRNRR